MLDVQTMFLKMCKGMIFDDEFLSRNQMDGFLRVPMSVESFEVPQELINTLNKCFNEFAGVGMESNHSNNAELIKELNKNTEVLMQFPDKTNQLAKLMEQLARVKEMKVASQGYNPEQEEETKGQSAASGKQSNNIRTVTDRNMSAAEATQGNGQN